MFKTWNYLLIKKIEKLELEKKRKEMKEELAVSKSGIKID